MVLKVPGTIFTTAPKGETTQMFISWWKDKQKVVSWYNGILWNIPQPQKGMEHRCMLQHGWNLKTLCQREEARQERPHTVWLHLRGMSRAGRSIDRKETLFARGWRVEGMGGDCLMNTGLPSGVMESSGTGLWWWLHSNGDVLSATESYLKMVHMVSSMLCVFHYS